eukprot:13604-Hanusia_phi.AAC.1
MKRGLQIFNDGGKESKLHRLCAGNEALLAKECALKERSAICAKDERGLTPIHVACCNLNSQAPDIVDAIVSIDPLSCRQVDNLGQLPLHIACRNEGGEDGETPNVVKFVSILVKYYPQAVAEEDMDGLLPVHWAMRNPVKGISAAVELLLKVYPDSAVAQPYCTGGLGIDSFWSDLVDTLRTPDGLHQRRETLSNAVIAKTRSWPIGHSNLAEFNCAYEDFRFMCPVLQMKRIFFNALRDRVAMLYNQRQKRTQKRKSLQAFASSYCDKLVGKHSSSGNEEMAVKVHPSLNSSSIFRTNNLVYFREWLLASSELPQILLNVKYLPQIYTPSLIGSLTSMQDEWYSKLQRIAPKDILVLREHMPVHLAAAHEGEDAISMLDTLMKLDTRGLEMRNCLGQSPLHVACSNESEHAEELVSKILETHPETAFAQDHKGMLPLHHTCLNSGPVAGSIAGRLISVYAPASQVADDFGRLPIECIPFSASDSVGELIKSVVRAFPAGARILDKEGNNILHRASRAIGKNPKIPDILENFLDLKVRPNACSLYNFDNMLPMHIAALSQEEDASRCIEMLAEAYIPGSWAQDANGDTPLHIAIRNRNLESVRVLTHKGRDKAQHIQNSEHKFPLNLASSRAFREVICQRGSSDQSDTFPRRIADFLSVVWFGVSIVGTVRTAKGTSWWWFQMQSAFLIAWFGVSLLNLMVVLRVIKQGNWLSKLLVKIIPPLKEHQGFLFIMPLSILQLYFTMKYYESFQLSDQIVLTSACVLVSQLALLEDGSRFHALEVVQGLSYLEIFVLFLFRVMEFVARVTVLAIAAVDLVHCNEEACTVKEVVAIVFFVEVILLLIFLRVTASQALLGTGFTEQFFLGASIVFNLQAIDPSYDLWATGTKTLVMIAAIVAIPGQMLFAYIRYILWSTIEQQVDVRFKLMSKREKILNSRSNDTSANDQMKMINHSILTLGKLYLNYRARMDREEQITSDDSLRVETEPGIPNSMKRAR